MVRTDPYTPERSYYGCRDCGHRVSTADRLTVRPECNGRVRNLAVARE